jgi:CheY-like chemotaxis protein
VSDPAALAPLLVLIIDDVVDNCGVYEHALTQAGARVLCAYDGETGLELARSAKPDVIVLDLGLPKLDGWEVARQLRGDDSTREVAIVACTAHADADAHRRALAAGIDVFLAKPCAPDTLVTEIRNLYGRGRNP